MLVEYWGQEVVQPLASVGYNANLIIEIARIDSVGGESIGPSVQRGVIELEHW